MTALWGRADIFSLSVLLPPEPQIHFYQVCSLPVTVCDDTDCYDFIDHWAITSPQFPFLMLIRHVPPEITSSIFVHCLPDPTEPFNFRQMPLALTRVCREWRAVAQGTPQLWTNVRLVGLDGKVLPLPVLEMWLSCSRHLPLRIVVTPTYGLAPEIESRYIRALCTHKVRWRETDLTPFSEEAATSLVTCLKHYNVDLLTTLERLSLDFSCMGLHESRTAWSSGLVDVLDSCPNLRYLSLTNWRDVTVFVTNTPPFCSSLQDLTLSHRVWKSIPWDWDMTRLTRFVQSCPNLVSLTLENEAGHDRFTWHSHPTAVALLQLQSLSIVVADLSVMAEVISSFYTPSLISLSLGMVRDGEDGDHTPVFLDPFLHFLTNCAATLNHFDADFDLPFRDPRVKTLLTSLPALKSLKLPYMWSMRDWADIFRLLTFNFSDDHQLNGHVGHNTTLNTLFIDVDEMLLEMYMDDAEDEVNEYFEALGNMVRSRCTAPEGALSGKGRPVARLEHFGIGRSLKQAFSEGPASRLEIVKQAWERIAQFVDDSMDNGHLGTWDSD